VDLVKSNNHFALELYGRLREQKGNLFFSPFSISTALSMTSAGARGATLEEMNNTLHLPAPETLHPALGRLLSDMNSPTRKKQYQLNTANALWGQKGSAFLGDFLDLNKKYYEAGLNEVDFAGNTEGARKTINDWVEKQTSNKIKDLFEKGTLEPDTQLVLTNAIYFKGDWATQFKKDRTRDGDFRLPTGSRLRVPLMTQSGRFNYLATPELQMVELPYAGEELSMVILLPRRIDGLGNLEKGLTTERLAALMKKMHSDRIEVVLPRFQLTARFELSRVLSELGMPLAFTHTADFSGMDGGKNGLYLSAVVHKAFVDVNEKGTEAAAATGIVVKPRSIEVEPQFRADHPFLFLIRERQSDRILFLGRMMNPKK